MRKMMLKLWNDDAGIVALEYILVATIVGLGLVAGLSALSASIDAELTDLGNAITSIDQSFYYSRITSMLAGGPGAAHTDNSASQTLGAMAPSNTSVSTPAIP